MAPKKCPYYGIEKNVHIMASKKMSILWHRKKFLYYGTKKMSILWHRKNVHIMASKKMSELWHRKNVHIMAPKKCPYYGIEKNSTKTFTSSWTLWSGRSPWSYSSLWSSFPRHWPKTMTLPHRWRSVVLFYRSVLVQCPRIPAYLVPSTLGGGNVKIAWQGPRAMVLLPYWSRRAWRSRRVSRWPCLCDTPAIHSNQSINRLRKQTILH